MLGLEICAFSVSSCVIAQQQGAIRAELCDNPVDGGTTPSYGAIKKARELVSIQLFPIIRPRGGNYFYSEIEFEMMKADILMCKDLGCDGISVGVQTQSGAIDFERMKRIVEWAYPMGVTCNRVFDAAPNMQEALESIINCGCERVLTSGQLSAAPDAISILSDLVKQADGRISIMPGAGVRSSNIAALASTGATEFHTSARRVIPNNVAHQNPNILDIGTVVETDAEEVAKIISILKSL